MDEIEELKKELDNNTRIIRCLTSNMLELPAKQIQAINLCLKKSIESIVTFIELNKK